ncbi:glycine-rich domain-containing protein [Qipengyuania sp. DGS5-3]|uniref:glycine-rich domain-containing protein n=1 Tax=Qipengyuania sp. DGS5-3 TaxID=3349632 RepID=UPI0036D3E73D
MDAAPSHFPDTPLGRRLAPYEIGPPDAEFSFAYRLSRENRWDDEYTGRVIVEYKRFCYLAMAAQEALGHDVTPSDAVDQAWHLHLTYSRDYWQRFCPDILGAEFHHGPTAGGTAERMRYYEQYAATLKFYEETFGAPPPDDIWAPAARRFGVDPMGFRINPADVIVLPRKHAWPAFVITFTVIVFALWAGGVH